MNSAAVAVEGASGAETGPNTRSRDNKKTSYRRDIDGLRAIAVLAVVTFHFFPAKALGGFVGVDIFFVISGYLISAIIYKEIEAKSFSIVEFYVRRIRRIYPALFLVLTAVCLAGWLFLLPSAFVLLGKQIIGGSTFIANIVLFYQSGYFSVEASRKPLLHLWSLGVEEQFYLLFPLICVAFYRARSKWILPSVFLLITAASMTLNIIFVDSNRDFVFYLPLTRLWELLVGAGLSLLSQRTYGADWIGRSLARWRTAVGLAGLALVFFSIFKINELDSFPGWWATLPTLGSAMIIGAGQNAWSNRHILSSKPAVSIGLVSYPLYLWHWPLFVFAKIATGRVWGTDLSHLFKILLFMIALVIAYLTYRFIELPVRRVREKSIRRRGALWMLGCVLMTGVFGFIVVRNAGFRNRFPKAVVALDHNYEIDASHAWREGFCFLRPDQLPNSFISECLDPSVTGQAKPLVFVWGDSHAADLIPGFRQADRNGQVRLAQYTSWTCPPLVGLRLRWRPACTPVNDFVLERIRLLKPQIVVLSASWGETSSDGDFIKRTEALGKTIGLVKAIGVTKVVVIGPAPSWKSGVPALLIDSILRNSNTTVPQRLPRLLLEPQEDALLRQATENAGATYVPLLEKLCDQSSCIVSTGTGWADVITYDKSHFTEHGSIVLAQRIWPAITGLAN